MRRAIGWLLGFAAVVAIGLLLQGLLETKTKPRSGPDERPRVDDSRGHLGPYAVIVRNQARAMERDLGIDARVVVRHGGGEDVAPFAERLFRTLEIGRAAPMAEF